MQQRTEYLDQTIKKLAGKYNLVGMSDEEQDYTQEDLDMLKRFEVTVSLELREDGTGIIDLFGDKMELTFDNKNMTYEDEPVPYTVEDGKIVLVNEDAKLTFEKVVEEEQ